MSYGFCYDESTDDYLLVVLNYKIDPSGLRSLEIFSLRNHSWQELSLTSYQLPNITLPLPVRTGSFLNGEIHWLISGRDDYAPESFLYAARIIAFDITTKYVREIETPSHDDNNHLYYDFGVLGGCLALTAFHMYDDTKREIEIWIMREYGVKSSWIKFISIVLSKDSYQLHFAIMLKQTW